ncbi:transcriptional regulator [Octadecabacter sp. SW4]|uniref:heme ABC transporter permease CcmC n=1 Tax=Octadecabacter sp. SW4 TaxID=2602067 RepID=UPI0011C1F45E|nr:heme ABC transporter permease CcmC [Octadecabacter sp. SW4]QEE35934.1 transcriptional regulator [Octadecabacter sp. SW4]
MSFWEYANPKKFIATTTRILPWMFAIAAVCLSVGLVWGFFFTPDDFRQGSTVKIIYLHVPAAMMAINVWGMMLVTSLIWLIRRHHVSALAARAAAPIGITMTLIALVTGAIWGQPMWGTWWAWDPRLTSFLILFLFYLGYMALWEAIDDPDTAADLTSVLCIVGSVFAFLSRFAVQFWNQGLHQAESVSLWEWTFNVIARFFAFVWNATLGAQDVIEVAAREENVSNVFFVPLLISMAGFVVLFVALVFQRTNTEIRLRRIRALETRARRG